MEIEPRSETIVASEPQQLAAVNDSIHDNWFDVDSVSFDAAVSTLSFPFARPPAGSVGRRVFVSRKRGKGFVESVLRVRCVLRWRIEDTNRVGYYDFNAVRYDPARKIVCITTGIPILIEVEVERLEVAVEINTRVL